MYVKCLFEPEHQFNVSDNWGYIPRVSLWPCILMLFVLIELQYSDCRANCYCLGKASDEALISMLLNLFIMHMTPSLGT